MKSIFFRFDLIFIGNKCKNKTLKSFTDSVNAQESTSKDGSVAEFWEYALENAILTGKAIR